MPDPRRADQSAAPDNVSDETRSVTDETRSDAWTGPGAAPSAEFLADLGMTAEQWQSWRRKELSRPPLVVPAEDATPEQMQEWRRELARPPMVVPADEDDG